MHIKLLERLCCPNCKGDLTLQSDEPRGEVVLEGTLRCPTCQARFDIVQGIPVLLPEGTLQEQGVEQESRGQGAEGFHQSSREELLGEVSRHHYLPSMGRAARAFARRLDDHQWILDIGAGWGWHWLDQPDPQIIALDFSLPMLLVARRLLSGQVDGNVHLVCADAINLPFKDGSLDGVWSVQMLQHLPRGRLERCLDRIAQAKKTEASVEVYWINWSMLDRTLLRLLGKRWPKERTEPYYFNMSTPHELLYLLRRSFGGKVSIAYNELIFHPELRLAHRLPLEWLDRALGTLPGMNRWMARQLVGRVLPGGTTPRLE